MTVTAPHLQQGALAEQLAATFLQQQGLKLLQRNFRCKYGEIDLIMQHGHSLVFVEVRLRSNLRYGSAADSIGGAKQAKVRRAAELYLQTDGHKHGEIACRFDALLMQSTDPNAIEWVQNAF